MTKRTEVYYPDGRVLVLEWEPGTRPAYEWLSRAVGGYIEAVDRFLFLGGPQGSIQAYANEEGRLRGMRGNVRGMKAVNWPEPPGGWDIFDPDNIPEPGAPMFVAGRDDWPEDAKHATLEALQRWDPIVGPVVIMRGWSEKDYYKEEQVDPGTLGKPVEDLDVFKDFIEGAALIQKTPGVCGGDACIRNTRIPVWALVKLKNQGLDDTRILESYPILTKDALASAWGYAEEHADEIQRSIQENEEQSE